MAEFHQDHDQVGVEETGRGCLSHCIRPLTRIGGKPRLPGNEVSEIMDDLTRKAGMYSVGVASKTGEVWVGLG